MPNGVICGGAVDGSNQLGEIVTCQAMTTRPAGADAAATTDGLPPDSATATKSAPNARRNRPRSSMLMTLLPTLGSLYMRAAILFGRNSLSVGDGVCGLRY